MKWFFLMLLFISAFILAFLVYKLYRHRYFYNKNYPIQSLRRTGAWTMYFVAFYSFNQFQYSCGYTFWFDTIMIPLWYVSIVVLFAAVIGRVIGKKQLKKKELKRKNDEWVKLFPQPPQ